MSDTTTVAITKAEAVDAETVSRTLARAFHEDPVFGWVVPDPAVRSELLPGVFGAFTDLFLPYGESYLAGEGMGAALWAPPGAEPFREQELQAFGGRLVSVLGEDAQRGFELGALLDEHRPAEPATHLQLMGVAPEHQGRGLGSRLLTTVLDRNDVTATPAYLEATSPDNRRLYERHGFETIEEVRVPGGPPLWTMWRRPQRR